MTLICAAHGVECCVVCTVDQFEREIATARQRLKASRAEQRRERREDGVFSWDLGGEV